MNSRRPLSRQRLSVGLPIVAVLCMWMLASPCVAKEPTGVQIVPPDRLPPVVAGPYEIAVGDILAIDFFKAVEMSQTRTVGPDGEIFLTLIGRVEVIGRTVADITREITERYSVEMVNPQITVSVEEFSGLRVYVAGEVRSPGIREYRGGVTLVQAIFDAGGFNERARKSQVLVIRRGPNDEPFGSLVNVKQILRKAQLTDDLQLAPMDTVYVHWKKIVNLNLFVDQYISSNLPRFGAWFYWIPAYRNTE